MKNSSFNRRKFVKDTLAGAASIAGLTTLPLDLLASSDRVIPAAESINKEKSLPVLPPKIKFSVIGLNHGHINSQVEAVKRRIFHNIYCLPELSIT